MYFYLNYVERTRTLSSNLDINIYEKFEILQESNIDGYNMNIILFESSDPLVLDKEIND